jgi:hypothetical protein
MKKIFLSLFLLSSAIFMQAQTDSLKEFTGRYVFAEGSVVPDVTVALEGEQLSMSSTAGTSALTKAGVDSFTIVEFQGIAAFKRNEEKVINAVHIEAGGYILDGTKEEKAWSFKVYRKPADALKGDDK